MAVALVDPQGRVLLQRRPPGKHHGGLWEFPGGKVESAETCGAALVREIREELGIELDPADLVPAGESSDARSGPDRDPHVLFLYTCRIWTGQPIAGEGAAIGWFTPDEARALDVPPLDRPLIESLEGLLSTSHRSPL